MSFANKVVVITGGSAGIGAATTILFSQHKANVVIVGRNETKLQKVIDQCPNKALGITADITNEDDVERVIEDAIETFGRIDVLINNAGIVRIKTIPDDSFLETYDELMATNTRAVVNMTNKAAPYLIASKGNIVNISSVAGEALLAPNLLTYGMSKAAVNYFTRSLALGMAGMGVRVNAISPGPVRTDIWEAAKEPVDWTAWESSTPLGRVSETGEIAELILFLASDRAKGITGVNYVLDNGLMIKA